MRPYYYLGGQRALTQLSNGLPFFVNTRDRGITSWIILGGTWENFVDDLICGVTREGDRVLDAGANQGYYSVKLGHIVGPEGRVVAFEPNPELFGVLQSNVDINGFASRTTLHRKALGEASKRAQFRFGYDNMGGGSIVDDLAKGDISIDVDVVRGDEILPPDSVFDVFKFDIEGNEPNAALGLVEVISRSPRAAIIVEISPAEWLKVGDFAEILARFSGVNRIGFEIGHDGFLDRLNINEPATMSRRTDMFYALLLPPDHWAIDFVEGRCRNS
jgi:FkbM family methyltransferase